MQKTNLNLQPYFDDFKRSKNYYRVLFKPNYPVQARELTTVQSILQNQIERFGQHIFKDGSIVIPGQVGYDLQYHAVLVQSTINNTSFETIRQSLHGKTLKGQNSNVTAKVLNSISSVESEKSTSTLYVKYISSGIVENNVQLTRFKNNEVLLDENNNQVAVTTTQNATSYIGSAAYITSGVFFIRGFFIDVPAQNIILDQYNNFSSYKIGLNVVESIVSADEDTSLYDNAIGSTNFTAPGADRLKIEALLSKQDLDSASDESFIELLRLKNGELIKIVENTVYNELEKNLARRTFDESGNYTVSDYSIKVKETFNNGENDGIYSLNDVLVDGTKILNRTPVESDGKAIDARNYYTVELSKIKAYVKGFEINNTGKKYTSVEKPRSSSSVNNQGVVSLFGNYIEINPETITGSINPGDVVTFKNTVNSTEVVLGKARALSLIGSRLYLADITLYTTIVTSETTLQLAAGDFIFLNNGSSAYVESVNTNTIVVSQINGTILPALSFTNSKNSSTYNINTVVNNKIEDVVTLSTSSFSCSAKLDPVSLSGTSFVVKNTNAVSTGYHVFDDSTDTTLSLNATNGVTIVPQSLTDSGGSDDSTSRKHYLITFTDGTTITDSTVSNITISVTENKTASGVSNALTVSKKERVSGSTTSFRLWFKTAGTSGQNTFARSFSLTRSSGGSTTITGTSTNFQSELKVPMKLQVGSSTVSITEVGSNLLRISGTVADGTYYNVKKLVPKIKSNGANLFTKIENNPIKSSTDLTYYKTIREVKTVTSGSITLSTTSNFSISSNDISITNSSGSVLFSITSATANIVTIGVSNLLDGTNVNVSYKVRVNNPTIKTKSAEKFKFLLVDKVKNATNTIYGTRITDKEISLKYPDVYKIHSIREFVNNTDTNDKLFDKLTLNDSANVNKGDIITKDNIKAKIIDISGNDLYVIYLSKDQFQVGTNLSISVNIISSTQLSGKYITTVVAGNYKDITKNFTLIKNDGPEFYNISKLTRNTNSIDPQNKFLVVFDYFKHNNLSNDLYTTNSYDTDQIPYDQIPSSYDGTFYTDIIDFRYYATPSSSTGTSGSLSSPFTETQSAFNLYPSENITTLRPITSFAHPGELVNLDYEYYLSRIDKIFLDENGNLVVSKGSPARNPQQPEDIPNALHLATISIPAYMKNVNDIKITLVDSKRYTMKDIGSIDRRLQVVEELTSLNLLEVNTNNLMITDEDGNNRFKTGFVADNFKTTNLADLNNVNYNASIDTEKALVRPYPYVNNVSLEYDTTSQTRINGSFVTLPYTEVSYITQNYASRVENLQPFEVIQWYGDLFLDPERDVWFDTVKTQTNTQQVDLSAPIRFLFDNSGAAGEQWGAWTTTGSARTGGGTNVFQERTGVNNTFSTLTQDINVGDTINSVSSSTFIRSRLVDVVCHKLKPNTLFHFFVDDVLNDDIIFPKSFSGLTERTGTFVIGETVDFYYSPTPGLVVAAVMPINPVSAKVVRSSSGNYTSTSTFLEIDDVTTEDNSGINPGQLYSRMNIVGRSSGARATIIFDGPRVKSDSAGTIKAFLRIPTNTYTPGTSIFKLCDQKSGTTIYGISDSSAEAAYDTSGTVINLTSNVLSLRTPQITSTPIRGTQTVFVPDPPPPPPPAGGGGGRDPLAQSFFVENLSGGVFVTSIELYFQSKDSTLPVSVELRTMENGTVTDTVLPNSVAVVQSANVSVSNNASSATKFTFPAPVFLNQNTEYAFMVRSSSTNYKIWVSRLAETDVTGGFVIDKQPYSGSLYKSQNMSVWTPDQFEDIKFKINRAQFTTNTTYTCKLYNKPVPSVTLPTNPMKFTSSSSLVEIYHPNHGMNSTQNYVTINGVVSEATKTTLNTGITSSTQTGTITIGNATHSSWNSIKGSSVSSTNPGYILINSEIIKYTAVSGNTLTIPTGGRGQFGTTPLPHAIGSSVSCYSLNGVPLSDINKTHEITQVVDLDRYKITIETTATTSVTTGGSAVTASRNIPYEEIYPDINILSIPSTNLSLTFDSTTGNTLYASNSSFNTITAQPVQNKQYLALTTPRIVASPINSENYFESSTAPSLVFNLGLSTEQDNLSPMIDVSGSSAITISNRIFKKTSNNQIDVSAELTPSSGEYSSYITKKITLANTSTSIKVLFDAIRKQGLNGEYSDIKVFVKLYPDGNLGSFDSMNYVEIPAVSYPKSSTATEYKAFDFELKNLAEFKEFSIKICMISGDQANIPIIRNFRAIALAV